MADSVTVFASDKYQLSHIFTPTVAVTVSVVTAKIIDVDDPGAEPLVAAGGGNSEAYTGEGGDGANAKRAWYTWTTPATGVDARYYLSVTHAPTAGGDTQITTFTGQITVWPRGSYLDRHIDAIQDWLQGSEVGERQAELGKRDYRRALTLALDTYNDAAGTEWTLSHTADDVPAALRSSLQLYAAGAALLGPQAARFLMTATPEIAADFINREPRSMSARVLALDWMKLARGQWGLAEALGSLRTGVLTVGDLSPYEGYRSDLEEFYGVS